MGQNESKQEKAQLYESIFNDSPVKCAIEELYKKQIKNINVSYVPAHVINKIVDTDNIGDFIVLFNSLCDKDKLIFLNRTGTKQTILLDIIDKSPNILKKLLDQKIILEFKDENQDNILHYLAFYMKYDIFIELYNKKNKLICQKNCNKETPIDILLDTYIEKMNTIDHNTTLKYGQLLLAIFTICGNVKYCAKIRHIYLETIQQLNKVPYGNGAQIKYNCDLFKQIDNFMFENYLSGIWDQPYIRSMRTIHSLEITKLDLLVCTYMVR